MAPGTDQKHVSAGIFGLDQLEAGATSRELLLSLQHPCPNAVTLAV